MTKREKNKHVTGMASVFRDEVEESQEDFIEDDNEDRVVKEVTRVNKNQHSLAKFILNATMWIAILTVVAVTIYVVMQYFPETKNSMMQMVTELSTN